MDFDNAEKIIESGKTNPKKTILIIILILLSAAIIALVTSFFGEKGKQLAEPPKTNIETSKNPDEKQPQIKNDDRFNDNIVIKQHTAGEQSPAIHSDGDVKIDYGGDK